jgi:UDP-GlcNAc3NAcA epimerase
MTGRMLEEIESLLIQEKPDWILVYGDTNSTLAGALAAAKLHIPLAHVEAGLRSHNLAMPEEVNRVLTDRVSDYLFCPTQTAVENLNREGFPFSTSQRQKQKIENVGDVMLDAVLYYQERAKETVKLSDWGVEEKPYALCTLHRQENTDDPVRLENILTALRTIAADICPVLLPLHPRTRKKIDALGGAKWLDGIRVLEPVGYLEMQRLQMSAKMILTDSGGMQKEAYFHQVPCITFREETEWIETLNEGWNVLTGSSCKKILHAASKITERNNFISSVYGLGNASNIIVSKIAVCH